jgi:hypothetical protein
MVHSNLYAALPEIRVVRRVLSTRIMLRFKVEDEVCSCSPVLVFDRVRSVGIEFTADFRRHI